MWSTAREIAAGDLVIIWQTRDALQPLIITPGKEIQNKFGAYRHSDLVGIPYGSKVGSRTGRGFIHVLRPTPELWTMALPHRTQILYLADISFIVSRLDIKPGSKVIEAGTGSGSFSHSIARTIGPSGRLYSYEFHEARASKAREEFKSHGVANIITLCHRNVCKDGFTVVDTVNCVFLDLPAPWDAVGHAKKALRKDRVTRICCFSPCMEQVLRTVAALNDAGFTDITMYETLIRPHEVHNITELQTIQSVGDKLKRSEVRREEKRLKQIAASAQKHNEKEETRKRKRNEQEGPEIGAAGSEEPEACLTETVCKQVCSPAGFEGPQKKARTTEGVPRESADIDATNANINSTIIADTPPSKVSTSAPSTSNEGRHFTPRAKEKESKLSASSEIQKTVVVSRVPNEVRGHTSYLTFACLLPCAIARMPNGSNGSNIPEDEATVTADECCKKKK